MVSEFEKLVAALIGHAYDTGYYSGKLEDATPHHLKAIGDRVRAKYALLAQAKALVEAHLRLLDICHFLTPSLIYKFLGDDAAVAAGLPLWPEHYSGDPSMQLDLSWAEAAAMPFKEADDAL